MLVDGKMDGVGGSESVPEDAPETGKVNPEPLSEENAHFDSGLLMVMDGKPGLIPREGEGLILVPTSDPIAGTIFVTSCP